MKTIYFLGAALILSLAFFSCQKKVEKEYNWAYPVAGDWTLKAAIGDQVVAGPFEVKIYNSSFGQDSIWLDDYNGNFYQMKFKAKVDMSNLTFETGGSKNAIAGYGINVKLTEGKVINKDSIAFKVEFSDDPGTIFSVSGHRTTSYDEYMQD
ncbi:lipid-binding protein [Niabella aurantiaca]|uniref:lipid-binding protein n=1 Tax=Niabella aurantiaca TaxID=379900 RepID=UPI00036255EE|nr:lipid-binding protein [Niabella aurantiaca]